MQLGALSEKLSADVPGRRERQSVNITKVEELICSQEDAPGTHISPRESKQITGIARSSIVRLTDFVADHRLTAVRTIGRGVRGEIDLGARACFPDKTGLKSPENKKR